MDEQRKRQAEEITDLRDHQGLTYRAIGEKLHITPGKVSYLYYELQAQRRVARYWELRKEQNQIPVFLPLTLGECLVLQKVLSFYEERMLRENSRHPRSATGLNDDPDFVKAKKLLHRISELDRATRREAEEEYKNRLQN